MHNEAFARIHLGMFKLNIDFFVARLCFKGASNYAENLFHVCIFEMCRV